MCLLFHFPTRSFTRLAIDNSRPNVDGIPGSDALCAHRSRPNVSAVWRVVLLGLVAGLSACNRPPPLAPELKAIKCPADRKEHASAMFANAKITFVCISKELAKSPSLLRCDLNSGPPMVCEDAGYLGFSRSASGEVYAGLLPEEVRQHNASLAGLSGSSRLTVYFRKSPYGNSFEELETKWQFLLGDTRALLPSRFTFVKGALCDREASALNSGLCKLEARSASLYWHIAVEVHADRGTPISAEQYRDAMAYWFKLLEMLVEDPAK